ncbi:hypothetical protein JF550_13365 [Microbacterium esteraromaticum]|uniref:Uncharacterized protein n=1 Tax=Microbacterium esteraromaticum TaxID=57043 RepID=A0A939DZN2_9MICO|nr:hypothetical protein [Microbacterium esteraromaticum]MBN7794855.1 hypothetical protein [Microbacterium esteraromaticum]MBN8206938.1 hypothetical protein [Microbacterium esteraromaticum]MBN8417093.1 hypothetical protein [Microbacterium esteraromaticum]
MTSPDLPSIPPPPPSGAYAVPVGGYTAPPGSAPAPFAPPAPSKTLGALALVAAFLAAVVAPIIGASLAFVIGTVVPATALDVDTTFTDDLALLSPARMHVLWAEITFWAATVVGVAAIVLGIIAGVTRRGRGMGIAAIVIAAVGPVFFFVGVAILFGIGTAVGTL